ncbi:MAG: 30S ribosomal protein S18 [Candidatus Dojkabacteria bacterium]|jgi:small subunit ribosomal protein S18
MSDTKKDIEEKTQGPSLGDVFDDSSIVEDEDSSGGAMSKKKFRKRRKPLQNLKCSFCEAGIKNISYKDVYQLKKYTSVRGKIISTEKSGICHKHQRNLKRAIKRARYMALLPYALKD